MNCPVCGNPMIQATISLVGNSSEQGYLCLSEASHQHSGDFVTTRQFLHLMDELLEGVGSMVGQTSIPQAFYDAFKEEKE